MTHSLIPERPICISPSLAATLGLEEATLLSLLNDAQNFYPSQSSNGYQWCHLEGDQVRKLMPFWRDHDIARIAKSLRDKGVLLMSTAPFHESQSLRFAINERRPDASDNQPTRRQSAPTPGAQPMAPHWQPGEEVYAQLAQHNIPQQFARAQIPEFVTYWRDQGQAAHSWNAKFIQQVLRKWRDQETDFSRREQEIPMTSGWRPSADALDVLVRHAGINQCFVEDAIAEFVLYWSERGEPSRTWNSKFIQHVRRQWARYQTTLQYDTEPRPIPANWAPSADVYEVLALANIDLQFAKQQLKEFVIYWRDTHQLHSSWNTKFLQHVKFQWAKRLNGTLPAQGNGHARQQNTAQSGRTRDRSVSEQLTDRSWAL
ncbi:DnaT-like ssDNA-binding domain-containing protein [Simiduia aestuariiviva]|uniref:DnaT DNA-binding domain-containing protein n=1 Tax=Simiduia aestuariiviva TaxID=1510459 RepID=A0A839UWD8_9GAMM|nr:DnaT-like ssDNA-binding domain-containing protein [Simiduia aestuariiviva]MBB3169645.1 hypothetical protein [Simiduia aestuariiviva]